MKQGILKRILTLFLVAALLFSHVPMNLSADTTENTTQETAAEDIVYESDSVAQAVTGDVQEYEAGFEEGEDTSVSIPDNTENTSTNTAFSEDTIVDEENILILGDGNESSAEDNTESILPDTYTSARSSSVGLSASNSTVSIASGQSTLIAINYSNCPANSTLSYGVYGSSFIDVSWGNHYAGCAYLRIKGKSNAGGNGNVYVYLRNSAGTLLKFITIKTSINYGYASPASLTVTAGTTSSVRIYHFGTTSYMDGSFTGSGFSASWGNLYSNYYVLNINGKSSGNGTITINLKNNYDIVIYTVKIYVTVNPSASISIPSKSRTTYIGNTISIKISYSISEQAGIRCTYPGSICSVSWGSSGKGYQYINITGKAVGSGHLSFSLYNQNTNQDIVTTNLSLKVTATSSGVHYYTYSFGNNPSDFGYSSSYRIPYAAYKTMFGTTSLALSQYWSSGKWGGSCFGMASTAGIFYVSGNGLNESSFRSGASHARNLKVGDYSSYYGMNVTRLIECMQIGQSCSVIQSIKNITANNLQGLYNTVSSAGNKPVQISIRGTEGGHALLAYKAVKQSSTERRIYVYDPNYPDDDERYIKLTTTSGGTFKSWYYKVNDTYNWGTNYKDDFICYIPYSYYLSQWNNRGNLYVSSASATASTDETIGANIVEQPEVNLIAINSKDFILYRMDENDTGDDLVETKVASYDETSGFVTEDSSIFPVVSDSLNTEESYIRLYVPTNELYIVKNKDTSLENDFQVNIANINVGASVSTSSDKVALAAFDGDGTMQCHAAANVMDAPVGTSYSVQILSAQEENDDVSLYQASGTVKSENETPGVSLLGSTVTNLCTNASLNMKGDFQVDHTHTIQASALEGGEITPSGTSFVKEGEDISYTVTPGAGCLISGILVDDTCISLTEEERAGEYTYTFENVTANHTITAEFEPAYTDSPSGLSVSVDEKGTASLIWNSVENASGYYLYRKTAGEKWSSTPIAKVAAGVTSYADTSLKPNTEYIYAVTAWRIVTGGEVKSKKSNYVTVTYNPPVQPEISTEEPPSTQPETSTEKVSTPTIAATTSIKAVSATYNSIKTSWKKVEGVSGYLLYRSTNKKTYKLVKDITNIDTVSYTDKKLTAGKTYYYKLVSYKNVASGTDTKTYKSTDSTVVKAKAAPAKVNLSSAKNKSKKKVKLSWKKISSVTGYKIYRSTKKSGKYKLVKTIKGSKTSWTNTGLKKGKTYYYKVRAYKKLKKKTYYGSYSEVKKVKVQK